jgi:hypothetical protein
MGDRAIGKNHAFGGAIAHGLGETLYSFDKIGCEGCRRFDFHDNEPVSLVQNQVHFVSIGIPKKIDIGPQAFIEAPF